MTIQDGEHTAIDCFISNNALELKVKLYTSDLIQSINDVPVFDICINVYVYMLLMHLLIIDKSVFMPNTNDKKMIRLAGPELNY